MVYLKKIGLGIKFSVILYESPKSKNKDRKTIQANATIHINQS